MRKTAPAGSSDPFAPPLGNDRYLLKLAVALHVENDRNPPIVLKNSDFRVDHNSRGHLGASKNSSLVRGSASGDGRLPMSLVAAPYARLTSDQAYATTEPIFGARPSWGFFNTIRPSGTFAVWIALDCCRHSLRGWQGNRRRTEARQSTLIACALRGRNRRLRRMLSQLWTEVSQIEPFR
jgi:hypothetical protein